MKEVTIYMKGDGESGCDYGNKLITQNVILNFTTSIEDEVFDIIKNGHIKEARKEINKLLKFYLGKERKRLVLIK